jgi:hypothetical protein
MENTSAHSDEDINEEKEIKKNGEREPSEGKIDWEKPLIGKFPKNEERSKKHYDFPGSARKAVRIDCEGVDVGAEPGGFIVHSASQNIYVFGNKVKHKTMAQFILVLKGIECFIFVNCAIVLCKTVLGPFMFM